MKKVLKKSIRIFGGLFILSQLYLSIKLYWLVSCAIPTYSMSPTLVGGDYIFASMQIPGRRIWEEDPLQPQRYRIHRKKGTRNVKKGDVVVFNFPYAENTDKMVLENSVFYCKRCVALPGETYQWQENDGSRAIYIPKVGDTIRVDTTNYKDYYRCIEYETGLSVRMSKSGNVYLADTLMENYCFRHNYYFMRGDNVNDSYDSRYWGLLPDDFILGVGKFIWFSKDKETKQIRWDRMFRKI